MRTAGFALISALLFLGCGKNSQPARVDGNLPADSALAADTAGAEDSEAAADAARPDDISADLVVLASGPDGADSSTAQPVDSSAASDGAGESAARDATKVQTVTLTAAQVFMQPTAPFLLQADLARGADGLFDVSATVLVSVSGCTGDACNRQVTMRLSREETTQVESWLAVIPGEACHDDPGPICDFGVHYAVGIDGPLQNQTCCKRDEWGQNGYVTGLHSYLQNLLVAQLNPVEGNPG